MKALVMVTMQNANPQNPENIKNNDQKMTNGMREGKIEESFRH